MNSGRINQFDNEANGGVNVFRITLCQDNTDISLLLFL